jgi:hypothetical protein
LIDHFYSGTEDEYQQEHGDITRRQQGLLKVPGSSSLRDMGAGRGRRVPEKIMIDAWEASIEDEQGQYDESVDKEFFIIQPLGYEKVGIEIIKCDQQAIIQDKKNGKISFREKSKIPRPPIEHKRDQQEASPGRDVNNYLYNSFLHIHIKSMGHECSSRNNIDEWGNYTGEWGKPPFTGRKYVRNSMPLFQTIVNH